MNIDAIRKLDPSYKDIPDPPFHPSFSNVLVWRLPEADRTAGGLFIPETSQAPRDRGVLLAAGLKAMDELFTNGYELGDVVVFAKYAGADMTVKEKQGQSPDQLLVLKAGDLLCSEGLAKRLDTGQTRPVYVEYKDGHGEYQFVKAGFDKARKRCDPGKAGK